MGLALTRTDAAYHPRPKIARPPLRIHYGELAAKISILTLFSGMAMRLAQNAAETGHVTGILMLASEALVVALTLVRRTAGVVDRSWRARLLTTLSMVGPPLVQPDASFAPETLAVVISSIGLMIVVGGKLSLGRSFGLTPANRGVVSTGLYRFLRHPIYLGYLVTHLGFIIANPADWNLFILVVADGALMARAVCEERTLAQDPAYRAYMTRARWRVVPGVF